MPAITREIVDLASTVTKNNAQGADTDSWVFASKFDHEIVPDLPGYRADAAADSGPTSFHHDLDEYCRLREVTAEQPGDDKDSMYPVIFFTGTLEQIAGVLFDFNPYKREDEPTRGQMDAVKRYILDNVARLNRAKR